MIGTIQISINPFYPHQTVGSLITLHIHRALLQYKYRFFRFGIIHYTDKTVEYKFYLWRLTANGAINDANEILVGILRPRKMHVILRTTYSNAWRYFDLYPIQICFQARISEYQFRLCIECNASQVYSHGLTLVPARISNHMPSEVLGEITYPFLNYNGATVEV